jgi:hypothetical protein
MDDQNPTSQDGLLLQLNPLALRPLIQRIVEQTLATVDGERAQLNGRLAYTEAEAAALLGLQSYQLRDERLKGRIQASVGPRGRILYSRGDLLAYLQSRRWSHEH